MWKVSMLDLYRQYQLIKDEIDVAIQSVIEDTAFIGGKYLEAFERNFSAYQTANHCVGVANGTDAIEIVLEGLALKKGNEIIVPANSFIASSEAVTRAGFKVRFCDCDPETYCMSVSDLEEKINKNTIAVIVVHLYGQPANMDAIIAVAAKHGLRVIEDCAQAHGARYKFRKVGTIGDVGTFSFYPGKNLGAYGDAGVIVTSDINLAKKCRMIANHGRIDKYNHEFEGRNSRLDGLQAAILDVKLKYLDSWIKRRREVAEFYLNNIKNPKIILPKVACDTYHVWHLFVIRCEQRDMLQRYLQNEGVQVSVHYPIALPKLKAYVYLNQAETTPVACRFDAQLLSLPMGEHLSDSELRLVVDLVNKF